MSSPDSAQAGPIRSSSIFQAGLLILLIAGWAIYMWGWPAYQWHFMTKPALLNLLNSIGGPRLMGHTPTEPESFKFIVIHNGVRVASPYPLTVDGSDIIADGFRLSISENFPQESASSYFAGFVGPLAVTEENVNAARTSRERALAVAAVEGRSLLFGSGQAIINGKAVPNQIDRAIFAEGPHSSVLMWSRPNIIAGIVMDNGETGRRDFMLKLAGIERNTAELIVCNLRYVGESTPVDKPYDAPSSPSHTSKSSP